jgi:hypothetical protein
MERQPADPVARAIRDLAAIRERAAQLAQAVDEFSSSTDERERRTSELLARSANLVDAVRSRGHKRP